jgi:hypothetical protein
VLPEVETAKGVGHQYDTALNGDQLVVGQLHQRETGHGHRKSVWVQHSYLVVIQVNLQLNVIKGVF